MSINTLLVLKRIIISLSNPPFRSNNSDIYRRWGLGGFFFFLLFGLSVSAQETVVVGQVFNKFDRSPMESVSVYFKGSNNHTQTNEEGYFLIRNHGKESVLVFSIVGFNKVEIRIKPGESAGIEILLEEKDNMLGELLVRPGANPANDLIRKEIGRAHV